MFLTQWFTAFLLWFVPESLREKGSGTERQAKLLVGFSAFLALSGIPFAFDAFNSQHNITAGTLLLGGAALVGAQPFVLKYWGSLKLSGHMMMGALFAILIGLASISTGMISTSMMWAAPTPLIAVLLMGNGPGFFWTVMVSLLYTTFYALEINNIKFVPMNSNESIHFDWYISLVGLSALVYILSRLYEQSRREALDELAEANKAKSFYLANMSHEIRTPLNAIIGYSELMLEDAEEYEIPTLQEDLNKVHISGKNLLTLINDVLDLSKIEAGKMEVFLEDIEINQLVEEIEVTTHPLAQKNNNTL
ncbi:MAG TPA: hypothetical protein DCE42_20355, partial [Myxococcales bacterium]|nr:hypothetical protein [Myxococcales bacterium]